MSSSQSTTRWTGTLPAITSKFHADESIDAEGTIGHIDFQIRNGSHGQQALATRPPQHQPVA